MGKIVTIAGWGTTDVDDDDKAKSDILQTVKLRVVDGAECLKLQTIVGTSDYGLGQFCAGGSLGKGEFTAVFTRVGDDAMTDGMELKLE